MLAGYRYVLLDEAQHIPEVGRALKIIHDNRVPNEFYPHVLVTGSSSLSLAGGTRENFLVSERMKANVYSRRHCQSYFWRVYTGAELDYVEEGNGEIRSFEFKLRKKRRDAPRSFTEAYPGATFQSVHMENWREFVVPEKTSD